LPFSHDSAEAMRYRTSNRLTGWLTGILVCVSSDWRNPDHWLPVSTFYYDVIQLFWYLFDAFGIRDVHSFYCSFILTHHSCDIVDTFVLDVFWWYSYSVDSFICITSHLLEYLFDGIVSCCCYCWPTLHYHSISLVLLLLIRYLHSTMMHCYLTAVIDDDIYYIRRYDLFCRPIRHCWWCFSYHSIRCWCPIVYSILWHSFRWFIQWLLLEWHSVYVVRCISIGDAVIVGTMYLWFVIYIGLLFGDELLFITFVDIIRYPTMHSFCSYWYFYVTFLYILFVLFIVVCCCHPLFHYVAEWSVRFCSEHSGHSRWYYRYSLSHCSVHYSDDAFLGLLSLYTFCC